MQRNQQKQKQLENSFNFNQSFNSVASPLKSIQKQTTLHDCYNSRNYGSDYSFIGNLYDRINLMKVSCRMKKKTSFFFNVFKDIFYSIFSFY